MFCPECGSEYIDGIAECKDCGIPLVEVMPEREDTEDKDIEFVTIFKSGDPAIIPIVKSLLDDAGIQYFLKDEYTQSWMGLQGWGLGRNNVLIGYAEFQVNKNDEVEAREMLKDFLKPRDDDVV